MNFPSGGLERYEKTVKQATFNGKDIDTYEFIITNSHADIKRISLTVRF